MSLSPLSNRYNYLVKELENVFSDKQYFYNRLKVELAYLLILLKLKNNNSSLNSIIDYVSTYLYRLTINTINNKNLIDILYNQFVEIDKTTQHDIKALEYLIKRRILDQYPSSILELVHCGLTSQDINSVGMTMMLNDVIKVFHKEYTKFNSVLNKNLEKLNVIVMGYTHGQAAIPVNLAFEFLKSQNKINKIAQKITDAKLTAKFSSSTGNYTTLLAIFSNLDNIAKAHQELNTLLNQDIHFTPYSRQIDDYTSYIELLQNINNLSSSFNELALNYWLRITRKELIQIKKEGEVGSSVMSHKINPWRLEQVQAIHNIISGLCDGVIRTISISKDSRDMSDSYALRYIGEIFGNLIVLMNNMGNDIERLAPNTEYIKLQLKDNCASLSEYIQTYLKWHCADDVNNPYKLLEEFTKGRKISKEELDTFIENLTIGDYHKQHLKKIKIEEYCGLTRID